ncbi:MAG: flagellar basal body rod protein FlgC [Phycisphaerales bacterium]|nr:flagellar basal body rod protein FlgC [Phycisphaerales bacterium]
MYGLLDISTSGMIAQRTRLEVATVNIANVDSILDPTQQNIPFRRRMAILAPGDPRTGGPGVHVASIEMADGAFRRKLAPSHPMADAEGYIYTPDIDIATETMNAIEATRAYEANVMAAEAAKSMLSASLRILA